MNRRVSSLFIELSWKTSRGTAASYLGMTLRDDRRHLPLLHWCLLLTCLALAALVAFQQTVIDDQGALIHLMSRDSSELAALKIADANKASREVPGPHDILKK